MRKISKKFEYSKLEDKAAKKLRIEEVFIKGKNFNEAIEFLKFQNFIPYKGIEKIIYLQKQNNFPIGYIMLNDRNTTVGFMGTWFSKRFIESKEEIFCNIHTWIVEKNYRLYSFYLLSKIYYENFNLIALTPVKPLKGLLAKMGFQKKELKLRLVLNTSIFTFKKNTYSLVDDKEKIENLLSKDTLKIYNSYSDKIYKKFILDDGKDEKKLFIIGCLITKKKLKIINFFFVSDREKFSKDYKQILNIISKKVKNLFFGEYLIDNEKSVFPDKIFFSKAFKRDIYIKSKNKFENIDLLNSDLTI